MSQLQSELKQKKICRFCLTQKINELASVYSRDTRVKSSAPLPVQVMAIASIEVFSNDGMPSYVCSYCRLLFEHSYRFKQMCKRADTLLRQYELTGQWPNPLPKPKIPEQLIQLSIQRKNTANSTLTTTTTNSSTSFAADANTSISISTTSIASNKPKPSEVLPKKILNSNPVDSPEPPVPMRLKKERLDDETIIFLDKMENNEELSMDDVQRLIAAQDENPMEFLDEDPSTHTNSSAKVETPPPIKAKPKLLNKSSIRILNKNAEVIIEPRLSAPTLKRDHDGNVAMVTEILDPSIPYEAENEPDPIKSAAPVETDCFPCSYCDRSFPLRQLRDIHMVNHSRERSFQCPECDKSFFSKYDLQKHNLVHTGDRPYKCIICNKAFTRATLLHRHEKTHTDIPKFICIYCEKPFISKEQMEQHTKKHLKNRPYQCKVCDKSFAFKQGVERHEVTHLREQPFPCQYCKQSFSTPSKLARHLTAHAGNRPYPCKFCSKSYLLSHHLTRHMRSHKNGDASFLCGACDKVFKTRDDLIFHSALHAAKTLICPLCKEGFEDLQSVTQHIKEHAEGEAFACEFCDLLFMSANRLLEHTFNNHAEDMLAYPNYSNSETQQQDDQEGDAEAEFCNAGNMKVLEQTIEDNMKVLEETIEEFLVDELPDEPEINENRKKSPQMKQEIQLTVQCDQPKILNQIIFQSNLNTSDEENLLKLDESNIVVANEPIDADNSDDNQQPAKVSKVVFPFSKEVVNVLNQVSSLKTSREPRRKVPSKSKRLTSAQNISTMEVETKKNETITQVPPIKKSIQPTITSVLNSLPKGVSIRRSTPGNQKKINTTQSPTLNSANDNIDIPKEETTISAVKTPSIKRHVTRRSNEAVATPISNKVEPKQATGSVILKSRPLNKSPAAATGTTLGAATLTKPVNQQVVRKSPAATFTKPVNQQVARKSPAASEATINLPLQNTGVKTMKMMLGDKKVKVQKITVTKAEAAAMAKDGRIHIKDGAMILTKSTTK